jgi:opacity protein-like surface antigen
MRKIVMGLMLASVLASPALARDGATYVGVDGGMLFGKGLEVDVDANGNGKIDDTEQGLVRADTKSGFDIDARLGHDFGMFRLEAEGAYKRAGINQLSSTTYDVNGNVAGVQPTAAVDGHVTTKSLMANGLLDFGGNGGVGAYVGGGVGYSWVDLSSGIHGATTPFVDDSDGGLSWQLLAGLYVPVTPNVDLGLKYRYFNVEDLGFASPGNTRVETDFKSHSILASLTYNFGGEAPPPPPVVAPAPPAPTYTPPPPPPPPPAMRTCADGTQVMATQACPLPPAPVVPRRGERG